MNIKMSLDNVPGTAVKNSGISGKEFLERVFFMSDGILLSRVREISGVDGSTLQNWVKRGWIGTTVNKRYSKNQLARILIINMLRQSMMLEDIDYLLHYINGRINDESDDIIAEAVLYGYICDMIEAFDRLSQKREAGIGGVIDELLADYLSPTPDGKQRLRRALEIIFFAYSASVFSDYADKLLERIK